METATIAITVKTHTSQATQGIQKLHKIGGMAFSAIKVAALAAGAAMVGIFLKSVDAARKFQTTMTNAWTLMDVGPEKMRAISNEVLKLSMRIPKSAADLGKAYYQAISSGITDTKEALYATELAAKAAVAGSTDVFATLDAGTSVINAYSDGVKKLSYRYDQMFTIVKLGKINYQQLTQYIGILAGAAAAVGTKFGEMGAMLAINTQTIGNVRMTVTGLKGALLGLLKPTDDAAKKFKELGISTSRGLLHVVEQIKSKHLGAKIIAELFPEKQATLAVNNLINHYDELQAAIKSMMNASGATLEAYKKQMTTFDNQMKILKNTLHAVFVVLGNLILPKLTALAKSGSKNSMIIIHLSKGFQIFMDILTGVAIGIGAVIKLILGAKAVGITWFELWKIQIALINCGILVLIKSATDAIGGAFNWIFGILEKGGKIWDFFFKTNVSGAIAGMKEKINNFTTGISNSVQVAADAQKDILGNSAKNIENAWKDVGKVNDPINSVTDTLIDFKYQGKDAIENLAQSISNTKNTLDILGEASKENTEKVVEAANTAAVKIQEIAQSQFQTMSQFDSDSVGKQLETINLKRNEMLRFYRNETAAATKAGITKAKINKWYYTSLSKWAGSTFSGIGNAISAIADFTGNKTLKMASVVVQALASVAKANLIMKIASGNPWEIAAGIAGLVTVGFQMAGALRDISAARDELNYSGGGSGGGGGGTPYNPEPYSGEETTSYSGGAGAGQRIIKVDFNVNFNPEGKIIALDQDDLTEKFRESLNNAVVNLNKKLVASEVL